MVIEYLLPVDADEPGELVLAPGLGTLRSKSVAVVDNGLWQSMGTVNATVFHRLTEAGALVGPTVAFNHLAEAFPAQLRAVDELRTRAAAALLGLGN